MYIMKWSFAYVYEEQHSIFDVLVSNYFHLRCDLRDDILYTILGACFRVELE